MEFIKSAQKRTFSPTPTAKIHEYDTADSVLNGCVAEIEGRYPESGFAYNREVRELVYVLSGRGKVLLFGAEKELQAGDLVLLAKEERFAWEGQMVLFIATSPKFDPAQYAYE